MSNREFPAVDFLGYSLDMTTLTPLDVKSVMASVKKGRRILQYDPDEDTRPLNVDGVMYDVPRCIGVSQYNRSDGNYVTYSTGSEASSSFKTEASMSVRYLAVSASASASYALDKTFKREDQFAFYSFNADTYLASMRDYADLLNETALKKRLDDLPKPFKGNDDKNLNEWKDFFASFGTHIILNASYGARFQLNVWASNSSSSVNERFSASVGAAFDGIGFGGKFDASVMNETQYRDFSAFMQRTVSVVGGDPTLNKEIAADPAHNDRFVEWAGTTAADSSLATMNVVELWLLMKDASKSELRELAPMVQEAYNYIVTHPQAFQTAVSLDILSDWAEFNLMTPSGVIIPDPANPWPSTNTVASGTRVQWGKEYSHAYDRKTLRFFIINDGSPIDFSTSHGSNGAGVGTGRAEVLMEGTSYKNDRVTDNVWNTEWFYQASVSSRPAPSSSRQRKTTSSSWNDTLNDYLREIAAHPTLVVNEKAVEA